MRHALRVPVLLSILLAMLPALAQTQAPPTPPTQTPAPAATQSASQGTAQEPSFVYKPPLRGAPARRVGGATRGSGDADMVLTVLAPDQTGLTTRAQPTLYWYASRPSTATIELTLIADAAEVPVMSRNVVVAQAGVHAIDLARYGVTLAPDTEYEWFVSAVQNPAQRSKDLTSGGTIRRVAPDPALQARIAAAGERAAPGIYADAGLWYDAIESLSRLIERDPGDKALRRGRAALLEQVGLPAAAASDR